MSEKSKKKYKEQLFDILCEQDSNDIIALMDLLSDTNFLTLEDQLKLFQTKE